MAGISDDDKKFINDNTEGGDKTMGEFLPPDTKIPASEGKYMRFAEHQNMFRVLGSAITGYELWVSGKPARRKDKSQFTTDQILNADINKFTGQKKIPQYFWAFPVWNYQTKQVEILEVTQKSVMHGIEDYLKDDDYGSNPQEYDIVVTRDETNDKVEYRVKAKPPKAMDEAIKEAYKKFNINLEALFTGKDPFSGDEINEVVEEP